MGQNYNLNIKNKIFALQGLKECAIENLGNSESERIFLIRIKAKLEVLKSLLK